MISNNSAPYFTSMISDIQTKVGTWHVINLPKISDAQNDNYIVTCKSKMGSLFLVATNKNLIINPIDAVVGVHNVELIIRDTN